MKKRCLVFTSIISLSLFGATGAFCQSDCDILGVVNNTFQGWTGYFGTWYEKKNPPQVIFKKIYQGIVDGRQTIRSAADGNVWWITDQAVPYVYPGDLRSIQLGNTDDGKQWERLQRTITVDEFSALQKIKMGMIALSWAKRLSFWR